MYPGKRFCQSHLASTRSATYALTKCNLSFTSLRSAAKITIAYLALVVIRRYPLWCQHDAKGQLRAGQGRRGVQRSGVIHHLCKMLLRKGSSPSARKTQGERAQRKPAAAGGVFPFRFGGQALFGPLAIGPGIGPAYVDRRVFLSSLEVEQAGLLAYAAILPLTPPASANT